MSELAYSDGAIAVLAEFNGVTVEAMRRARPNASNSYMHDWMELAADARRLNLKVIHDGRFLSPSAIKALIAMEPHFPTKPFDPPNPRHRPDALSPYPWYGVVE